jgi:hypothetical protein
MSSLTQRLNERLLTVDELRTHVNVEFDGVCTSIKFNGPFGGCMSNACNLFADDVKLTQFGSIVSSNAKNTFTITREGKWLIGNGRRLGFESAIKKLYGNVDVLAFSSIFCGDDADAVRYVLFGKHAHSEAEVIQNTKLHVFDYGDRLVLCEIHVQYREEAVNESTSEFKFAFTKNGIRSIRGAKVDLSAVGMGLDNPDAWFTSLKHLKDSTTIENGYLWKAEVRGDAKSVADYRFISCTSAERKNLW